jgi:hypothetical protein
LKASSVLGGDYIKSDSVKADGPQKVTIVEVGIAEFENDKTGKKEKKLEVTLTDERKLTLNNGNTETLISAFGDETDEWPGKSFVIYHDPNVKFGNKRVGGIRVKVPASAAVASAAKADDPFTDQF